MDFTSVVPQALTAVLEQIIGGIDFLESLSRRAARARHIRMIPFS
jgi:hypothetical protein